MELIQFGYPERDGCRQRLKREGTLDTVVFQEVRPVWINGLEKEMNVQAGFTAEFRSPVNGDCLLRLTGSTLYRIRLNGVFVHYGPARAPHGFARVDEIDLGPYLQPGTNRLDIEVSGSNCNTYYMLNVPSFLQAEVLLNGAVVASTGKGAQFRALELASRVRKVMRYSFQRGFTEVYRLDCPEAVAEWESSVFHRHAELTELSPGLRLLPREVPVPAYEMRFAQGIRESGTVAVKSHGEADVPWNANGYGEAVKKESATSGVAFVGPLNMVKMGQRMSSANYGRFEVCAIC